MVKTFATLTVTAASVIAQQIPDYAHYESHYSIPTHPEYAYDYTHPTHHYQNDWDVHDAYGIRPYEDAYGRPVLYPAHSYNPYNVKA